MSEKFPDVERLVGAVVAGAQPGSPIHPGAATQCEVAETYCESSPASLRKDPLLDEIHGEAVWRWYCDRCYDERSWEV